MSCEREDIPSPLSRLVSRQRRRQRDRRQASGGHIRTNSWLRLGTLAVIVIAGSAAAASNTPVSSQALAPVPPTTASEIEASPLGLVILPRPLTEFHTVIAAATAPPPPAIVSAPGGLGIPRLVLAAYRNAEAIMAKAVPGCGVSWNLLAGIGRVESGHANNGATDAHGKVIQPIYGPSLDGSLPGNEMILDSERSSSRAVTTYVRAIGPMQFLPSTWARYASDAKGDGVADPQNIYDASLAAARYLCSGGLNLQDRSQVWVAILRYNNSVAYAQNVLGWAAAYATGVYPTDLPLLTAADTAPERKAHLSADTAEGLRGLGPGSAPNVTALTPSDPLAQLPFVNPVVPDSGSVPGPAVAPAPDASCVIICLPASLATPPANTAGPLNPFASPAEAEALGPPPGPAPGPLAPPAAPKP